MEQKSSAAFDNWGGRDKSLVSETRVAVRGDIDKIEISFLSKCQLSENINNYNKGKDKIENIKEF